MYPSIRLFSIIFMTLFVSNIFAQTLLETESTASDQKQLSITIYGQNLGLIRDQRTIQLKTGEQILAFKDVSASMKPETALFYAPEMNLLEQNFEYDLLTNETLLKKYLGKQLKVLTTNYGTGEEKIESATVLSVNNGAIFKINNQIVPMRSNMSLIYDELPSDLRDKPTLTMHLNNKTPKAQKVELTYLTDGLNWQADYVINIIDNKKMNLQGWVTINNQTGTSYNNVSLQLVAGDLNRVREPKLMRNNSLMVKATAMNDAATVEKESLMDYHLYTMPNSTNIANNQTKQLVLLQAQNIPYSQNYIVSNRSALFYQYRQSQLQSYQTSQNIPVRHYLYFKNDKETRLGFPLPKGVIRTYKQDSHNQAQFVGEDRIEHTPENQSIMLLLGDSFDLTAKSKVVHYDYQGKNMVVSYDVELSNAKDQSETIKVQDVFNGNWKITSESIPSTQLNANLLEWSVPVPAKSTVHLTYSIMFIFN